jgi:uncharacterized protein (DUF305 family)
MSFANRKVRDRSVNYWRRQAFRGALVLGGTLGFVAGACMGSNTSTSQAASDDAGTDAGPAVNIDAPADAPAADGPLRGGYGCGIPFTAANDVEWIDATVPHHEESAQMADQVLSRGATDPVKQLALRIKQSATDEVVQLRSARQRLAGSGDVPPPAPDPMARATMARLTELSGPGLEQMFLESMVVHESMGSVVAHRALPNLMDMQVFAIAQHDFEAAADQVGELQLLRHSK